jgi:hypothetical protein
MFSFSLGWRDAAAVCALVCALPLQAQKGSAEREKRVAVVYPFALASHPEATPGPSGDACPEVPDAKKKMVEILDPKIGDALTHELQKKLAKKMTASVAQPGEQPKPGTLVFAGCLTTVEAGNAAERMAGFNLGASHLGAHVVVARQTDGESHMVQEFDVSVKGGTLLPPLGPIGLVTHALREMRETLTADAKRLADEVLRTLEKDEKKELKEKKAADGKQVAVSVADSAS